MTTDPDRRIAQGHYDAFRRHMRNRDYDRATRALALGDHHLTIALARGGQP